MNKPKIPLNKPFIAGKELHYISRAVLVESHLSGDGHFTKQCHDWLETHLGCRRVLLTHSCTGALEMAAILLDIQPGDEIIMPSFTFVSTANAFVLRGGVPVFVDIREDTLNIDERLIGAAITERTRVIVPVHYAGVPCAMDEINGLARRHNLRVVEDAAQALFSGYKERYLGTIGSLGCLSFHETKNVMSGEGGALLINDEEFIERAEIIREKGTNRHQFFRGETDKYTWVDIGSSFLPSELVGAFLYAQLEQAGNIVAARQKSFQRYSELLQPLAEEDIIRLPFVVERCTDNGHIFYIITRSLDERSRLTDHLRREGILAVFHYVPLHSSPAGRKYGRVSGGMEVTNHIADRLLRLPMYYEISEDEIKRVAKAITTFYFGEGKARTSSKVSPLAYKPASNVAVG